MKGYLCSAHWLFFFCKAPPLPTEHGHFCVVSQSEDSSSLSPRLIVSEPVLFLNGHTEERHLKVRRIGQVLLTNLSLMVGPRGVTLLFASSWMILIQALLKSLVLEMRCFMGPVLLKPEQPEKEYAIHVFLWWPSSMVLTVVSCIQVTLIHLQLSNIHDVQRCQEISWGISEKMVSWSLLDTPNLCRANTFPLILNPAFQGEFNSYGSDWLAHRSWRRTVYKTYLHPWELSSSCLSGIEWNLNLT